MAALVGVELWSSQGTPVRRECQTFEAENEAISHCQKLLKDNPDNFVRVFVPGSRADVHSSRFQKLGVIIGI